MAYKITVDKKGNIYKDNRYLDTNNPTVRKALQNDPQGIKALAEAKKIHQGTQGTEEQSSAPKKKSKTPNYYNYSTFSPPRVESLSWEDALKQSKDLLYPLYQQALSNAQARKSQQENLLESKLNAKGQLGGGREKVGLENLTADYLNTLSNMDAGYMTQLAQAAMQLQNENRAENRQAIADAFNRYLSQNQLGLQVAGHNRALDRDIAGDEQWNLSYAYSLLPYLLPTISEQQSNLYNWASLIGKVPSNTLSGTIDPNMLKYIEAIIAGAK